jgi:hypothetical protein
VKRRGRMRPLGTMVEDRGNMGRAGECKVHALISDRCMTT